MINIFEMPLESIAKTFAISSVVMIAILSFHSLINESKIDNRKKSALLVMGWLLYTIVVSILLAWWLSGLQV